MAVGVNEVSNIFSLAIAIAMKDVVNSRASYGEVMVKVTESEQKVSGTRLRLTCAARTATDRHKIFSIDPSEIALALISES
jgi:hypothetical protein